MKLFKYFLLLFIIYLINILPVQAYQNDYLIEKYDLNIIVNENNTFDITENITAYFNIPKHGIIRNIPIKNEIRRLDGSTSSNITELSNLNINDKYSLSRSGGYYKIQIGSQNKTITGAKNYTIKYNYNLGKDPLKDKDELYFNIIGNEWDTKISNITFKITMPKDFDKSKLGFSSGAYGSTSSKNIEYEVKDNVITGKYIGTLNAREGITIRCELPEGYFVNAGFPIRFIDLLFIIFPMLSLLIALLLWFKYGKDEKYQKKLTPYPPKDINSLELGYIYKGNVTEASIASLLIYLANKGYLKIEPIEEKSLFKTTYNLKIIKQKEYTDTNLNEKLFLNDLFLDRTHPNNENNPKYNNEIISLCIDDSYYDISKNLDNQKTKFFEKTKTKMLTILIFMIIISYLFITIPPIVRFGEIDSIGLSFIIPFGIFFALLPFIDTYNRKKVLKKGRLKEERSKGLIIVFPIFLIFFAIVPFCFSVMPAILTNSFYFLTYFINIFCIIGIIICIKYMPKRTPYGSKIYSQIKDFQNFINEASKEQLLSLIKEDPNYLYYILPFTYSLGNTDILFEKFKDISFNPPTWWQSKTNFDFSTFSETILTNLINFENSIPFINYQEPTDNNSKEQENPINNSFNPEPENNSNTNQSNAATLNNTKEISPKKEPTQNKFIKAFLKIWNLSSYIELIIFIPLILIGIFLTTSNSYLLITEYLSSKNYLKTEGKLTKFTDCENEAEFGNTCKGIYEYQVNGKTYQASPKILTNTSNFKKTATVKYNPSNPQESIIYPPVISLIIAGLLLTILPLCFFFYTKKKSKDFFSQLDGSIKPSNKKAISKLK